MSSLTQPRIVVCERDKVQEMNNRDILFEIAIRLDNVTLFKLHRLRELLEPILTNNEFWYRRAEMLVGRSLKPRDKADWKSIYYSLLSSLESNEPVPETFSSLDNLLVNIEVFGAPQGWPKEVLVFVTTPEVLDYLIKGGLEIDCYLLDETLISAVENDRASMIIPLTRLHTMRPLFKQLLLLAIERDNALILEQLLASSITEGIRDYDVKYTLGDVLDNAVKNKKLQSAYFLLQYEFSASSLRSLALTAVESDVPEALKVILEKLGDDLQLLKKLFYKATMSRAERVLALLLQLDERVNNTPLDTMLINALKLNQYHLTKYLLTRVKPTQETLLLSARNAQTLKLLLEDRRVQLPSILALVSSIDPSMREGALTVRGVQQATIRRLTGIDRGWNKELNEAMLVLLADERVKLEDMDLTTLKIVLRALGSRTRKRIEAWFDGYNDVDDRGLDTRLDEALEKNDIYSLVLRYILVYGPSSLELLAWMISAHKSDLVKTARMIIEGVEPPIDSKYVPIRALMLSMLYPTMTFEAAIQYLEEEGASERDIALAAALIAAHTLA